MRVCMLAYTFYEMDSRVIRYAETLAKRGHQVEVITLRQEGHRAYERMNGVHVYRIQTRVLDEAGLSSYVKKLLKFLCRAAWFLAKQSRRVTYDLVHVHNMPSFLVFTTLIPKLRGAKVILDIHDLTPELYESRFKDDKTYGSIALLKFSEKMSIAYSDFIIIANDIWRERLCESSVQSDKIITILNYPDLEIFYKRSPKRYDGKFIVIYPGTLSWHQGIDVAVRAFSLLRNRLPHAEFHIYGDGHAKLQLMQLVQELDLQDRVLFKGWVTLRELGGVVAQADLGVIPKRKDSFGNEAFSTKILEFMAIGLPVIVSDTKIDKFYFGDDTVCFFTSGNPQSLADSIVKVHDNVTYREQLIRNALSYIAKNNWGIKELEYLSLVERLTHKKAIAKAENWMPEADQAGV